MVEKQLIIAIEGTSAMGPYWNTVLSDYLEKIIRCFCGNESNDLPGQMHSATSIELSVVVFNVHGSRSACGVQRSGWTRDVNVFLQWLSAIPFSGGGFSESAVGEGLSEALMMFSLVLKGSQNVDIHKHCVLLGARNPYLLPTPVYRPQISKVEHCENMEVPTEMYLADAEAVAKTFAQFSISLSVISTRQLPKLRAIYNAGKHNSRAADPSFHSVKNPRFLVLLSENFTEAHAALSHAGIPQSLRPTGSAAGYVSILYYLSQARQMMSSASLIGASDMGLQMMSGTPMAMHMPNIISSRSSSAMQTEALVKYMQV